MCSLTTSESDRPSDRTRQGLGNPVRNSEKSVPQPNYYIKLGSDTEI